MTLSVAPFDPTSTYALPKESKPTLNPAPSIVQDETIPWSVFDDGLNGFIQVCTVNDWIELMTDAFLLQYANQRVFLDGAPDKHH